MKTLLNKLSLTAALSASAFTYSGCEVLSNDPRVSGPAEQRMLGALGQGVVGGALINRGIATNNAGAVALGQGVIGGAMQQPQTSVIVNTPAIIPVATMPASNGSSVRIMLARDFNYDNIITPNELVREQYTFQNGDLINLHITNLSGHDQYIRFQINHQGKEVFSSSFMQNLNGQYRYMTLFPVGQQQIVDAGDYELTATDNEGHIIGKKIFNVVGPSTPSVAQVRTIPSGL